MRVRPVIVALVLLAGGGPSSASAAVELVVAPSDASSGAVTGPWAPLPGAALGDVGSHAVGAVLTGGSTGADVRAAVRVPSGESGPLQFACILVRGTAPTNLGSFQYVGTGGYAAVVSVYPEGSNCSGSATPVEAPFSFADASAVAFVGQPLAGESAPATPFRGVRATVPPGPGNAQLLCALDPVVGADGELTGSETRERDTEEVADAELFDRAGRWGCVARRRLGGSRFTPWSPPATADVAARFVPKPFALVDSYSSRRTARFRLRIGADAGAAGGTARVTLRRCRFKPRARDRQKRARVTVKAAGKLAAVRGPAGNQTAAGAITLTLPFPLKRYVEVYELSVAFDGTSFVRPVSALRIDGAQRLALQRSPDGRAYATLERPASSRKPCTSFNQTSFSDPIHG